MGGPTVNGKLAKTLTVKRESSEEFHNPLTAEGKGIYRY